LVVRLFAVYEGNGYDANRVKRRKQTAVLPIGRTAVLLSLKHSYQVAALGKANVSSRQRLTPKQL
jgi:hypothetical protein